MTFTNSVLLLVSTRKLIKASLAYLINSVTLKAPMADQEMAVPFEISRELQAKNKQVEGTLLPLTNCREWQVQSRGTFTKLRGCWRRSKNDQKWSIVPR
ncbi:hypothetical protein ACFX14_039904 [Malus domestica]